jgi:hypothetical protein
MFLTPSDFKGKFELHTGMYDQNKLVDYIARYEKRYLIDLLGAEFYNEFISDLDENFIPSSPNFQFIFNPFYVDRTLCNTLISDGIVDMLKGFIYFEYTKDLTNQMTPFGGVIQKSENSTIASTIYSMMYNRYNESVRTFRAIQQWVALERPFDVGQSVQCTIVNEGSGYFNGTNVETIGYFVTIIGGVQSFEISDNGTGYTTQMNVSCSGGSGSGLIVDVWTNGFGNISLIQIVDAGVDYEIGDEITIDGGNDDATFDVLTITSTTTEIANGNGWVVDVKANGIDGVGDFNFIDGGTDYTTPFMSNVLTTGGAGVGCVVNVNVDSNGTITDVFIMETGFGFEIGDVLTIVGGGNDATFEITDLTNGEVTNVSWNPTTMGGVNYQIGDHVFIDGGDGFAELEIMYVGIGDGSLWNGKDKQFAYWI